MNIMLILVKLLGIIIVVMGFIFLINPTAFKQYASFWQQRKRIIMGGILSLLFGVIFLLVASECKLRGVIIVFGIWAIIKGVLLFALEQEKLNAYLNWWIEKPLSVIRFFGFITLAVGILLIYSV